MPQLSQLADSARNHASSPADAAPRMQTGPEEDPVLAACSIARLNSKVKVGDLVFTRIGTKPFREIAKATGTWINHVGIVTGISGVEPIVSESRVPLSGSTTLRKFVHRSVQGRVAVTRLPSALTDHQALAVKRAAQARAKVMYDTGFNLRSKRQFCTKYAHEILGEATGQWLGEIETFDQLFRQHPNANVAFWKLWFLGNIPWQRQTLTPASLHRSPLACVVFDGYALALQR